MRYTITAALPYANGPVHIGHLAGVYFPADIYARYLRLKGDDVAFICGSDEHGVPITIRAQKEGITPQQVVDKYHAIIGQSFKDLGIEFDIYSRTSSATHKETSQQFFTTLHERGLLEVRETEQYYDEEHQQFLADRYIIGTCPVCANPGAYGDQCEKCGSSLSPEELINPHSALTSKPLVKKLTKHWYLPLDKYEPWLREYILEGHKADWKANVYGQCKSWIDAGLHPRAVTRDLDWGVPVPLEEANGKVLYVWFDAPIGYISATMEWAAREGKNWEDYWLKSAELGVLSSELKTESPTQFSAPSTQHSNLIHFIGKDNIVFHCIIFPVMLHAEGRFIVPTNVPANEFLNLEGDKISTSRNWAVWAHEYLEDLPGKQDVLRYVLTATAPETKDNDFTWKDYQARNNNELVAILGNFVNRTLVLIQKYYEGHLPDYKGTATPEDMALVEAIQNAPDEIGARLDVYRFRDALFELIEIARVGNRYLADQEPWKLIKTDPARTAQVLHLAAQHTAALSLLMEPFLPFTSKKLRDMLNLQGKYTWHEGGRIDLLRPGHVLPVPSLLFEKIEDDVVEAQIQKLQNTKMMNQANTPLTPNPSPALRGERGAVAPAGVLPFGAPATAGGEVANANSVEANSPLPPQGELVNEASDLRGVGGEEGDYITIDDFSKIQLRVATVIDCQPVPKADKLLNLTLELGDERRTVLSGIAQHFKPEEVVGRQVVVVANLAPRKMRGIDSQGMILMAEDAQGKLVFVSPTEAIASGAGVK